MTKNDTEFDHEFTMRLIIELEAFLQGRLVGCLDCTHFGPLALARQVRVRLPGHFEETESHICNECWLERKICHFCQESERDGEIVQVGDKLNDPGSVDVWACHECFDS